MTAPLIDILLATYNGARYLAPQLDSLLGQTHQHFRLLVSDDGSTDATLDILRGYRAAFGERLILLPNRSPGAGVVRNFERLMQASLADGQAQWAASCDQDDVWLPDKLATQWAEMQRIEVQAGTQTPCLVHGDLTVVNERLEVISPSFAAYQRADPAAATALSLLSVNQVTGCAMMVNRALLRMALPVPADQRQRAPQLFARAAFALPPAWREPGGCPRSRFAQPAAAPGPRRRRRGPARATPGARHAGAGAGPAAAFARAGAGRCLCGALSAVEENAVAPAPGELSKLLCGPRTGSTEPVPAVALAWMAIKLVAACACLAGVRGVFLLEMMVGRTGINNATRD